MLKKIKTIAPIFAFSLMLFSCTSSTDMSNIPEVKFNTEVLPIFQANCTMSGCHGNEDQAEEDLNFTNYAGIMKSIKANSLSDSKVYEAITNVWEIMPPSPYKPLNKDQRTLIAIWIMQGAKNN